MHFPNGLAVDATGNLYVADADNHRVQKWDTQGNWSVLASPRLSSPIAIAVDAAGSFSVSEHGGRLLRRDPLGNWSVLAPSGHALGQVKHPWGLAVDGAGNLYVAENLNGRIQKWDVQGNWSSLDTPGQLRSPVSVAVDPTGNLSVAEYERVSQFHQRDPRGNWSILASQDTDSAWVCQSESLAADAEGSLFVIERDCRSLDGRGKRIRRPARVWRLPSGVRKEKSYGSSCWQKRLDARFGAGPLDAAVRPLPHPTRRGAGDAHRGCRWRLSHLRR
jgi:DNA-binding beta-propeller fold protein YncE